MRATMILVFLILLIVSTWVVVANNISSSRANSWMDRAKDAGNPAQVAEFLNEYKQTLNQMDRVEGKYYTIFKYPGTYMPTYIRAVDGLIERATALSKQASTDESYQMGLINLEKDLGDLEPVAFLVWGASGGFIWQILIVVSCFFVIIFLLASALE